MSSRGEWVAIVPLAAAVACGRIGYDPTGGAAGVTTGDRHSCALRDGALACWGDASVGALGAAVADDQPAPIQIGTALDWSGLAAGAEHTCGLRSGAGSGAWCWGANDRGQLGTGDRTTRTVPTAVGLPRPPANLAAGDRFACVVGGDAEVSCWGQNDEGQLGLDDAFPGEDAVAPATMPSSLRVRHACAGQGHACAVTTEGSLWCWGRNTEEQLGLGPEALEQIRVATRVGEADDWATLTCGHVHTCATRTDGSLWCWGVDFSGATGLGVGGRYEEPTRVGVARDWRAIAANAFHTCGVHQDTSLWCWGRNAEGQLGVGDIDDRDVPTLVAGSPGWTSVATGRFHTCATRDDETVWCAGENVDGQLGVGDTVRRDVLTEIQAW